MSQNIILYKTSDNVTQRRPSKETDYVKFSFPVDKVKPQDAKAFIKGVITELSEVNYLKNDFCFLIEDLQASKVILPDVTKLDDCTIFYTWVCLPYMRLVNEEHVPENAEIIPFDIGYWNQHLPDWAREKIQGFLRECGSIYTRRLYETPKLPIPIKVVGARCIKVITESGSSSLTETSKVLRVSPEVVKKVQIEEQNNNMLSGILKRFF